MIWFYWCDFNVCGVLMRSVRKNIFIEMLKLSCFIGITEEGRLSENPWEFTWYQHFFHWIFWMWISKYNFTWNSDPVFDRWYYWLLVHPSRQRIICNGCNRHEHDLHSFHDLIISFSGVLGKGHVENLIYCIQWEPLS